MISTERVRCEVKNVRGNVYAMVGHLSKVPVTAIHETLPESVRASLCRKLESMRTVSPNKATLRIHGLCFVSASNMTCNSEVSVTIKLHFENDWHIVRCMG